MRPSGYLCVLLSLVCPLGARAAVQCNIEQFGPSKISINGEEVLVTATFTASPPGSRKVFTKILVDKVDPNLKQTYHDQVKANIPNDSCGTEITLNSVSLSNSGTSNLEGRANVTAHKWLCIKGSYPCWHGNLWPETCYGVILREDDAGFTKTVDVITTFHAYLLDQNNARVTPSGEPVARGPKFQIEGTSRVEGFSDLEQALIGLFTDLARLIKMASFDLIDFSEIAEQLVPSFEPFRDEIREALAQDNFHPEFTKVDLRQNGAEYVVHTESDTVVACSIAEQFRAFLVSARKEQIGDAVHTVLSGDNLWKITEAEYGNGLHFRNVEAFNNLEKSSVLQPGQTILLPKLEKIYGGAFHVVRPGDSLYAISKAKPERSLEQLRRAARDAGRDPNLIYPTDILKH
ncbi:LysM peptidoglycan-binding domain-containing protein [Sinorhizobium medicae]